jgi:predicted homoserine dehydrogenase-like protein
MSTTLPETLEERLERHGPIRVALVGAGKFGSMFLAQVPTSPHLAVIGIADLDPDRARRACHAVGWQAERVAATHVTDDAPRLIARPEVEVVIEATGDPAAGIAHARAAGRAGKHIVMVNVEADVLAGPLLAAEARAAGTVYSLAWGDQPALVCDLVDWARTCGFAVVAAGKGTRYQPHYHAITPADVWSHYGLEPTEAAAAGMNAQMFASFMDGTKSAIEMAAIANATGLAVPAAGLGFPASGTGDLPRLLKPRAEGGLLEQAGMVEVVASAPRGEVREFADHLRWGVYVVFRAPNDYARACFRQYGLATDESGWYAALTRPYHLIGLELGASVVSAAVAGRPTGCARAWVGDVVAVAKRDLEPGVVLDGEGGYCVWGRLVPSPLSAARRALPIGLAHGLALARPVSQGEMLTEDDVKPLPENEAVAVRRAMVARFGPRY